MLKRITITHARANLGQILNDVSRDGHQFLIERSGKQMATVIPVEFYEQWRKEREAFFAMTDEIREPNKGMAPDVIERDIAAAVRAARKRK